MQWIGATCHYDTADLDLGLVIEQDACRIDHAHSVGDLVRAGRTLECRVLGDGLRAHVEGRVVVCGQRTVVFEPRCRDFQLVAFDMDSTPKIECTDEVADAAGRKAEVAPITAAAMRGEITDDKDTPHREVPMPPIGTVPKSCCTAS